jgi:hypothetical protein
LFEGGFEVFDDFLGQYVGIGKVVGYFEAFVFEPEDLEVGFVAVRPPLLPATPTSLRI